MINQQIIQQVHQKTNLEKSLKKRKMRQNRINHPSLIPSLLQRKDLLGNNGVRIIPVKEVVLTMEGLKSPCLRLKWKSPKRKRCWMLSSVLPNKIKSKWTTVVGGALPPMYKGWVTSMNLIVGKGVDGCSASMVFSLTAGRELFPYVTVIRLNGFIQTIWERTWELT